MGACVRVYVCMTICVSGRFSLIPFEKLLRLFGMDTVSFCKNDLLSVVRTSGIPEAVSGDPVALESGKQIVQEIKIRSEMEMNYFSRGARVERILICYLKQK